MLHISLLKFFTPFKLSMRSFCNFLDRFLQFGQNLINGVLNVIFSVLWTYSRLLRLFLPTFIFLFSPTFSWSAVLLCFRLHLAEKQPLRPGEIVPGSLLFSRSFIREVTVILLLNSQELFSCQTSK